MSDFDSWWENEGQYNRAGGSNYEKTFAWEAWNHKDKEVKELQSKIERVLEYLEGESADHWGLWKEKADMMDQAASNALEEAYWFIKKMIEES